MPSGEPSVAVGCAEEDACYRAESQRQSGSRLQTAAGGKENTGGEVSQLAN